MWLLNASSRKEEEGSGRKIETKHVRVEVGLQSPQSNGFSHSLFLDTRKWKMRAMVRAARYLAIIVKLGFR
jgi:hypothetical protein